MTDAMCGEGIQRAARSLRAAFENGADRAAREDMCVVSLFGGLALANADWGPFTVFAGVIAALFDAPHAPSARPSCQRHGRQRARPARARARQCGSAPIRWRSAVF